MNCLITAGNTMTLIDKVRCITNIFSGRTGTRVALAACARGHAVTLLTSHPEVVGELAGGSPPDHLTVRAYRTFAELRDALASHVTGGRFDAVIQCAAVSDYECAGVYAPAPGTRFDPATGRWQAADGPVLVSRDAGKVKSDEPEVWLRLVQTPKLIDMIRDPWGFRGVLVKFKLEVGVSGEQLRDIAERSRRRSDADLMVANTLEGMDAWALLGPLNGGYHHVPRADLSVRLIEEIERRRSANNAPVG
jgi:phosphopantothenate-cysteine ligase/phosphopantothenoylcysteine decarboxylase/phosphopantothenate--cysteine ligase